MPMPDSSPSQSALRKLVYLIDVMAAVGSFVAAFALQSKLQAVIPFIKAPPDPRFYLSVAFFTIPLWIVLVPVFRLHLVFERFISPKALAMALVQHHLAGFAALSVMLYITQMAFNRSLIALFMGCSFVSMYSARLLLGWRRRYDWRHGYLRSKLILVGEPSAVMRAFIADAENDAMPPEILGWLGGGSSASVLDLPRLGDLSALETLLHEHHADQVLFFPPYHTPERAGGALIACETVGVKARLAIDLSHPGRAVPRMTRFAGHQFVTFDTLPPRPELRALKHGFDALAAGLGLLLLSPLFAVVSSLILITMGRPVFFVQARAGMHGRTFRMVKFRTMKQGAAEERAALTAQNEMAGPVFKIASDPRVTRLGRYLRRSSIDELPQLVNVLFGTMSLVGPRPLPIEEQQNIRGWHRRRLSMKPGITGLWQVSGRSNIDFHEWMALDLKYIDNWSLWLDLKLLLKTAYIVLIQQGAK
jgi:exopolysaccharide biosynthesis polyprenyl glycosylphosphotransferase